MSIRNLVMRIYEAGFKTRRIDSVPLPQIDPKIPWSKLEKMYGITGEVDDYWDWEKEDSDYYRREPKINREFRRLRKRLAFLFPEDFGDSDDKCLRRYAKAGKIADKSLYLLFAPVRFLLMPIAKTYELYRKSRKAKPS